jgi:ABC-type polysaccharide/polyol phosphate export permease
MSTTPPEQPPTSSGGGYDRPGGGPNVNFNLSALPVTPGNAELVVYILATILIAIIALASDGVDSGAFVTTFTALTFAYLISRGIAKASRVLEQ